MGCFYVIGIRVSHRNANAPKLQEVLTKNGCQIKLRVGLHDAGEGYCSDDGVILPETEIGINSGDTVYEVLKRASKKFGIQVDVKGTSQVYVSGISYIYEFDFGEMSGWLYFVNGESPSVSCGEYLLSDRDSVEWRYTVDLGKEFE